MRNFTAIRLVELEKVNKVNEIRELLDDAIFRRRHIAMASTDQDLARQHFQQDLTLYQEAHSFLNMFLGTFLSGDSRGFEFEPLMFSLTFSDDQKSFWFRISDTSEEGYHKDFLLRNKMLELINQKTLVRDNER